MSAPEDEYSVLTIVYLGLDDNDLYGISLSILNDTTDEDVDVRDGMIAIDMLFETGKLLK